MKKKRFFSGNFLSAMIVGILLVAIISTGVAAAARVDYKYEDGKAVGINRIEIDPYTYYDVSDIVGTNLDIESMKKLSGTLMSDWSQVAAKVFKSKSVAPKHSLSGSTWDGSSHNWAYYYENSKDIDNLRINLVNWLRDEERNSKKNSHSSTGTFSTGLSYATDLGEIRTTMAKEIANHCGHISYKEVLEQRSDKNGPCRLNALTKPNNTKAFYNIVTSLNSSNEGTIYYNSYGVVFYDFELIPIADENLTYTNGKTEYNHTNTGEKEKSSAYFENTSGVETNNNWTLTDSITQTITNSIASSKDFNVNIMIGSETKLDAKLMGTGMEETIKIDATYGAAFGVTKGYENGVSESTTLSSTVGLTLPPHTAAEILQQKSENETRISYDCPVAIGYKVAIFSMSGAVRTFTHWFTSAGDFCTKIGYGTEDGGYTAAENLYLRAFKGIDLEEAYGQVEGYLKGELIDTKINWRDDINPAVASPMERCAMRQPLAGSGATMNINTKGNASSVGNIVPYYRLTDVKLDGAESEYKMFVGDSFSLSGLNVAGYDGYGVPFYGFRPDKGYWVHCDVNGDPYTGAKPAVIIINPATKKTSLYAVSPGRVYLKWVLDDEVEYSAVEGNATVSATKNPPNYPVIQFDITPVPPDLTGYTVAFNGEVAPSLCLGETLNLNDTMKPAVYDGDGKVAGHVVSYELRDAADADKVKIDNDHGELTATETGSYGFRAVYEDSGAYAFSDWTTVTVLPARQIDAVTTRDVQLTLSATGDTSPGSAVAYCDLHSLCTFKDQYGDVWTGEPPTPKFTLAKDHGDDAVVTRNILEVHNCGVYDVDVTLDGIEAKIEATAAHDLKEVPAIAATCTKPGNIACYHCELCDEYFKDSAAAEPLDSADIVIAATDHKPKDAVKEKEQAPTKGEYGSYDLVVYCDNCNEELRRETISLPPLGYTVTAAATKNGKFEVDAAAIAGNTVVVVTHPDLCYVTKTVTATTASGKELTVESDENGAFAFTMAAEDVTVAVEFSHECPSLSFKDLDTTKWYHEGVDYVLAKGYMNGTGADTFGPNNNINRAMIVTILYRLDGEPKVDGDMPFSDVPAGKWYSDAILWAAENNIVTGYSATKFGPNDEITREQMATILYRYATYKKMDVSKRDDLSAFKDKNTVSDYAVEAMKWAVAEGYINGTGDGKLSPKGKATRAQFATILMRFDEK